ncbi:hypothetical protein BSL78_19104 [Apostichopus japonicus]|uniref:RRM domain-containing protein n=1 Tax=Stichopus japonicus TaxID=307972 RepID=A0A2G8K7T0_STIJA|nr:hypothetical protein BSL78_19104 [Apostichopus japonicus]
MVIEMGEQVKMEDQVKIEEQVKRIFVGGLPSSTTDSEVRDRFGKFADISDVNLAKKDSVNGKLDHCFAHFNFHGNELQLKKLISTFNNTRWQGKTLKIEKAKEDFLDRLSKEKLPEPQNAQNIIRPSRRDRLLENLKKAGVTDFTMKKAVPGTGIAGEKNWVVGKYGRVLPVVYMRSKDRKKVVKFDPSKYIHHLKQIKDVREK